MTAQTTTWPEAIRNEAELDDLLSTPTESVIETMGRLEGDLIILGVAGKMGPTLALMARRAGDAAGVRRRIMGVSRFSRPELADWLQAHDIEPIRCDLVDADQVARLPDAPNIVAMLGMKFGTSGQAALTWATNCLPPAWIGARYPQGRIVAFSTGNVYGWTPITSRGSRETDPLAPIGEYAMTALGRERIYEHVSRSRNIPMALIRLNYACELRYGVLVDLARKVFDGEPIDLTMGAFNTIWQGDANAASLQAFDHLATPPTVFNLTGGEVLRVRDVAEELGRLMDRPVIFVGAEAPEALLSDASETIRRLGPPRLPTSKLIEWVAAWVRDGGGSLGKPTHFEARDGRF